jgi:hypothetical protein
MEMNEIIDKGFRSENDIKCIREKRRIHPYHLLVAILLSLLFAGCKSCSISDAESRIRNDSLALTLSDQIRRFLREKQLFEDKVSWQKLVGDTAKLKERVLTEIVKLFLASESYYDK